MDYFLKCNMEKCNNLKNELDHIYHSLVWLKKKKSKKNKIKCFLLV